MGVRATRTARWQAEQIANRLRARAASDASLMPLPVTPAEQAETASRNKLSVRLIEALWNRRIDVAVVPVAELAPHLAGGVVVAATPPRETPFEAVVYRPGLTGAQLAAGMTVAVPSPLPQAQLARLVAGLKFERLFDPENRWRRIESGAADAAVFAPLELAALGVVDREAQLAGADLLVPPVGQGAVALLTRSDDIATQGVLNPLHDKSTALALTAERAFLGELESEHALPLGALAEVADGRLMLYGALASWDGARVYCGEMHGSMREAEAVGLRLADEFVRRGARVVMGEVLEETRLGALEK